MATESMNLESQISEIERLRTKCISARDTVNAIRRRMRELTDHEGEQTTLIHELNESELRTQLDRTAQEVRDRLAQSEQDIWSVREAASETREQKLAHIEAEFKDDTASIRQKLQSELWVLQSVCDESNEDTPVREAERENEVYQTHKRFAEQQTNDLNARVVFTEKYLEHCHAGMDATSPPVNAQIKGRDASRALAMEQVDLAMASAGAIDRQNLPQWICGFRIWGLSLLIFLIVASVATAIRADLRLFLNPDLQKPDWQWLGVSCLIGAAIAVLFGTVLLMLVQSRLRAGFEDMLQHAANAKAAIDYWNQRSEHELKKIDAAAETWKVAMLQHRDKNSDKLQNAADGQISQRTAAYNEQIAKHEKQFHDQIAASEADFARQQAAVENWRGQEIARIHAALKSQHDQTLEALIARNAAERQKLQADEVAMIGYWKADVSVARELARSSRERVAMFPRWSQMRGANWHVPTKLPVCLPIGDLLATLPTPPQIDGQEPDANLCLELPGILNFPRDTSIAVEHDAAGREPALEFVRSILLRLLTSIILEKK